MMRIELLVTLIASSFSEQGAFFIHWIVHKVAGWATTFVCKEITLKEFFNVTVVVTKTDLVMVF